MKIIAILFTIALCVFGTSSFAQDAQMKKIEERVDTIVAIISSATKTSNPESKKETLATAEKLLGPACAMLMALLIFC